MDLKTRLRKACDACSIRKVKVSFFSARIQYQWTIILICASVILVGRLVGHALAWIFHAPMKDQVDAAGLLTATQRLLRNRSANLMMLR